MVVESGGIKPLVALLTSHDGAPLLERPTRTRSDLVTHLACTNTRPDTNTNTNPNTNANPNPTPDVTMEQSASALARLSLHTDESRVAIAEAGGIAPLIAMLDGKHADAHTTVYMHSSITSLSACIQLTTGPWH